MIYLSFEVCFSSSPPAVTPSSFVYGSGDNSQLSLTSTQFFDKVNQPSCHVFYSC